MRDRDTREDDENNFSNRKEAADTDFYYNPDERSYRHIPQFPNPNEDKSSPSGLSQNEILALRILNHYGLGRVESLSQLTQIPTKKMRKILNTLNKKNFIRRLGRVKKSTNDPLFKNFSGEVYAFKTIPSSYKINFTFSSKSKYRSGISKSDFELETSGGFVIQAHDFWVVEFLSGCSFQFYNWNFQFFSEAVLRNSFRWMSEQMHDLIQNNENLAAEQKFAQLLNTNKVEIPDAWMINTQYSLRLEVQLSKKSYSELRKKIEYIHPVEYVIFFCPDAKLFNDISYFLNSLEPELKKKTAVISKPLPLLTRSQREELTQKIKSFYKPILAKNAPYYLSEYCNQQVQHLLRTTHQIDFIKYPSLRKPQQSASSSQKKSSLDFQKTLESFDSNTLVEPQKLNSLIQSLDSTKPQRWIFFGASGTGKTHLAHSIGLKLFQRKKIVRFMEWNKFFNILNSKKNTQELENYCHGFCRVDLLILDGFCKLEIDRNNFEKLRDFFGFCSEPSLIITSLVSPEKWKMPYANFDQRTHFLNRIMTNNGILEFKKHEPPTPPFSEDSYVI